MKENLSQNLYESWSYVEKRDIDEDNRLRTQIHELGLPLNIVDDHVHCGRKEDIAEIPLERLRLIKTLNNRRWFPLSDMRELHKEIFDGTQANFWAFPLPYLETKVHQANDYLTTNINNQERVLVLSDQANHDYTIQEVDNKLDTVIGVKAYYDQIPILSNRDPESISNFEFFPRQILKYLNSKSLMIMLHVSRHGGLAHPDTLSEVITMAQDYPNLNIILAHMGRCYNPFDFKKVINVIKPYKNLLFETSMVDEPLVFEAELTNIGHERLLFGTDLPLSQVRFLRVLKGDTQITLSKQESWAIRIPEKPDIPIGMNVLYMTKALLEACKTVGLNKSEVDTIFSGNANRLVSAT